MREHLVDRVVVPVRVVEDRLQQHGAAFVLAHQVVQPLLGRHAQSGGLCPDGLLTGRLVVCRVAERIERVDVLREQQVQVVHQRR